MEVEREQPCSQGVFSDSALTNKDQSMYFTKVLL